MADQQPDILAYRLPTTKRVISDAGRRLVERFAAIVGFVFAGFAMLVVLWLARHAAVNLILTGMMLSAVGGFIVGSACGALMGLITVIVTRR